MILSHKNFKTDLEGVFGTVSLAEIASVSNDKTGLGILLRFISE